MERSTYNTATPSLNADVYSDFYTNLTIHPNKADLVVLKNEAAVMRSIKNIILTSPGERFYNKDFGCGIKKYLFEPLDNVTIEDVRSNIVGSIGNFEKRANVIEVLVSYDDEMNALYVSVVFTLINSNKSITLNLKIDRVR
jgi:hypothetical protein